MIQCIFEFLLIGLIGGLLGIFYRNCLKEEDMIFHWWYVILSSWVEKTEPCYDKKGKEHIPNIFNKILGFIAYPLGFCIYCSTTWITFLLCALWLISLDSLPDWNMIVIGVLSATGVQHLVIISACKFLLSKHPDLNADLDV